MFFKIFAFFFETKSGLILSCSSRLFRKRGGWGRRAHIARPPQAAELTQCLILKKGSNLRINRAHLETLVGIARRGGGRGEQIERCDGQKFEPI